MLAASQGGEDGVGRGQEAGNESGVHARGERTHVLESDRLEFRSCFATCCMIFFHFWLHWVFIVARDFLVAAHGLSLVAEHGLSRPLACGILVP